MGCRCRRAATLPGAGTCGSTTRAADDEPRTFGCLQWSALLEIGNRARGTFTATQAAAGAENDIRLRVYGERGMLDWWHREPSYLKLALQGEPVRTIGRGDGYLSPEIIAAGRTPRGHPEGLREAFANLYAEVAQERMALSLGEPVVPQPYPRIEDGAHTMAFIEACIASSDRGAWAAVATPIESN